MPASAAHKDVTVLITGESGTGKEVVARALHQGSRRATGPFVPVNCGAIPADLLESELFGHDKGAFTGAITQKMGRLELAHGGTLFLDEIGDLPFSMQVKLLRAIEQKSFERLGSGITRVSDVRIVAATNNDLEAKIADGEFREDLFYRLNVFPIELSPLRERSEDLPLLINTLVARIHAEQALQVRLSVDALNLLAEYAWPGNVRELANLLQRLAIQYPNGLVRSIDLPKKYTESANTKAPAKAGQLNQNLTAMDILLPVNGIDLKDYLARLEKSLIEQALQDTNAVVARAADRLHIRRTTLVEKMRKHGLGRNLDVVQ
ncbi:MAG: sigma-54-dependent Fis family transcriptional regulator [Gammaproteobacteria bacterium]|nr:sigma-54-dependent Fis family transcriptional regulator [Gammaproteobacteria bacterium]